VSLHPAFRMILVPVAAAAAYAPAQALVYMSVEQAQQLMFKGQELTALPVTLSAADIAAIEADSGVKVFAGGLRAWKADNGYFFVDAVIGKHELITYAVALSSEGKVLQTEILEYREAYGGEVRSAGWRQQFTGRQHGDPVRIGRDIKNISGATLSSEHVTDGIRRLLATYAIAIAGR
jgi:Na+-translocating ferredoxin:NAD+ oxidoreductase RnfG subunit